MLDYCHKYPDIIRQIALNLDLNDIYKLCICCKSLNKNIYLNKTEKKYDEIKMKNE